MKSETTTPDEDKPSEDKHSFYWGWIAWPLVVLFAGAVTSCAGAITMEDTSPHLSADAQIIWKAPSNALPRSLWVYKVSPNTFTAQMISNAVVLASFESKGIPKPSTNRVILWDQTREGDDPMAGSFAILPDFGQMVFNVRNHALGSSNDIPSDKTIAKQAWEYASRLGLDHAQLSQGRFENSGSEYNEKGRMAPENHVAGRTITFVRRIDGVDFQEESEGFSIEFGSHGVVRSFGINWPNLKRFDNCQTVGPEQIIRFIRANKSPVFPNENETTYFQRIRSLSRAKTFTITKITPHYGEWMFGEAPKENELPRFVTPYAELQAVADFGKSNMTVRLATPIIIFPKRRK